MKVRASVKVICPKCKVETSHPAADVPGLPAHLAKGPVKAWRGSGCRHCGAKGYRGRSVVAEICEINDELRQMIVDRRPAPTLREAARRAGMQSIYEDAIAKLTGGITTLEEVLQHQEG